MMRSKPMLHIVIVNWNSGRQLRNCLISIYAASKENYDLDKIVVVDNASVDGSIECLNDIENANLKIIRNSMNIGFAAACNQGAEGCQAEYLLFLNPDVVLNEKSLSVPIGFLMRRDCEHVGICGIQLFDDRGRVSCSCARFPSPRTLIAKTLGLDRMFPRIFVPHFMTEWDHAESRPVNQVMGAFFLVRRQLFEVLEGFDERFFVYFEEVDFSLRAWKKGWTSYYIADTGAYHRGCGTTGTMRSDRLFYSLRSRILYGYKHFNPLSATVLAFDTLFVEAIVRLVYSIVRGSSDNAGEIFRGYVKLWRSVPTMCGLRNSA